MQVDTDGMWVGPRSSGNESFAACRVVRSASISLVPDENHKREVRDYCTRSTHGCNELHLFSQKAGQHQLVHDLPHLTWTNNKSSLLSANICLLVHACNNYHQPEVSRGRTKHRAWFRARIVGVSSLTFFGVQRFAPTLDF
jgi:hypothetical protein